VTNPTMIARHRALSVAFGAFAAIIGFAALAGWVTGNEFLKGGFAASITMKTNTALCLLLSGLSLVLLSPERPGPLRGILGRVFALVVVGVGGATLIEHIFDVNLGIDEFVFHETAGAVATYSPNRMGPPAATCFPLIGLSLLFLDRRTKSGAAPFQCLALAVILLASISALGYVFDVRQFYGIARYTGIAFPTAMAFLLLAVGILFSRPEAGVMRRIVADDSGALMIRRLLPAAILLPIALMWLRMIGQNAGLYDIEFGRALVVLGYIVTFTILVWATGGAIAHQQRTGARAEAEIRGRLVNNLESMADGFMACDSGWRITYMNAAAERIHGMKREDVLGRTLWEAFPGMVGTTTESEYRRAMSQRVPIKSEVFHESQGRVFENDLYPTDDGGLAVYGRDITEHTRALAVLRESEELFRTIGEAVPDFLWRSDLAGRFTYQNPAWAEYTGQSSGQLRNARIEDLVHPEDIPAAQRIWGDPRDRGASSQSVEIRLRRHDGLYRWFSCRIVPLRNPGGEIVKWIGTATDVDELRRAQEVLRLADRRKDEFLATLAHELRNPLAPVRNAVQLLRLKGSTEPEAQWAHVVIERQVDHFTRLIEDLMDVSRISHNKLELRKARVTLNEVISGAIESARPLIEAHGHDLSVDLPRQPLYLDGDTIRLAQVFMNLLTNAAKYTPQGGEIRLVASREGSDVVVRVRDTGIGIAPNQLPHVFEMFYQTEDVLKRTHGGLGIGLALVRYLVELHGGTVTAQSAGPGHGSEFTVRLPLSADQLRASPAPLAGEFRAQLQGRRVLVVDDNEDAAASLSLLIRLAGAEVHTAHDGQQAIELAGRIEPEIALLDIGLPTVNGYDVARSIRGTSWGRNAVLIALTGWGQEDDRERSREAGFNHHLVKPVSPESVVRLLHELPRPTAPATGDV
jgi:PAS domain S-box-containing protein